jgi:hypothetical protein
MHIRKQLCVVVLNALLLAACAQEDTSVPGGPSADAGLPADEVDATVTPTGPDAMPAPDAAPGTPDAAPVPDAGPPPVSFSADIVPILMARCGGCHLKDAAGAGGLSLGTMAQLAYPAMANKPTNAVACTTLKVVDTTDNQPMHSSLYAKIVGDTCGTRMPKNNVPLTDEQLALFSRWISEGSKDN